MKWADTILFDQPLRDARLLAGARLLELPVLISEQYPRGLGPTAPELDAGPERRIEKSVFSAARAEGFDLGGCEQALLCGIETHVCVSQTVHDLLADGVQVHVPADAVGSRHDLDHHAGLERMQRAGAVVSSVEAACSPPITEMRAFGHIHSWRGP